MRLSALFFAFAAAAAPLGVSAQVRWPADQETCQLVPGKPVPVPQCRSVTPVLTSDSVGPVHPGMRVGDLLRVCPRAYLGWHWEEGIPEPGAVVRLGRVLALALLQDTTGPKAVVYRILIADSNAKTVEGIGPHSRLGDMIKAWGVPKLGAAECALYASFETRPHLSWIMEFPSKWDCGRLERFVTDSSPDHLSPDLRAGIAILAR